MRNTLRHLELLQALMSQDCFLCFSRNEPNISIPAIRSCLDRKQRRTRVPLVTPIVVLSEETDHVFSLMSVALAICFIELYVKKRTKSLEYVPSALEGQ